MSPLTSFGVGWGAGSGGGGLGRTAWADVEWRKQRVVLVTLLVIMTRKSATQKTAGKDKVEKVMHEFKEGTLKSGSGQKVTSRKQAIAVGLSEAREAGARIPPKKKS